ncbi:glucose-6-phosphate isomerase [Leeia aquatica]|uniref:Glucose-6-phosphate isomerase n=1 Tax=Leeia aquatica TaxID=2725557 RepID=A0A847S8S9_9NEIS|nr:glucose-6-phosphate isomerase [Leeia aquatica]NLR75387.1 glucose-6-phosphate isomerase [Leeia aquatica]
MSRYVIQHTPVWQALIRHHREAADWHMRDLFARQPDRFARFSLTAAGLRLDYSKNRINEETIALLCQLAQAARLPQQMQAMRAGAPINYSEQRAALHVALRHPEQEGYTVVGQAVMPQVHAVREQMRVLVDAVRAGQWRGYGGATITDVVNIGIGGSDLGPRMVVEALQAPEAPGPRVHFLSNIDPEQLHRVLSGLNPARTLFIVVSKSFTTLETRLNAEAARTWLLAAAPDESAIAQHFVAVSSNLTAVQAFGIAPAQTFAMWDWVGGRYSVWSAVGLSVALAIGMDAFDAFLAGGHAMDDHFFNAPLAENMPVLLGLMGIWYNTFFKAHTHAVMPYVHGLRSLPAHLQQLDMESNGKRIGSHGERLGFDTGPIIWGDVGVNVQHAFFQLLHQGTRLIPADFIVCVNSLHEHGLHQDHLFANGVAQTEALMRGKTREEARLELQQSGVDDATAQRLLPHKVFPGNQPSNTLLLDALTPAALGALLALYEHKVFVQGVIWGINSFDQWGVEYGKQLAQAVMAELQGQGEGEHDASTQGLLAWHRQLRQS